MEIQTSYRKIKSDQELENPITDQKINSYQRQDLETAVEEEEGKNKLLRPLEARGQKAQFSLW